MPDRALRILQVSCFDLTGGAAKISWDLFQAYRARGHASYLAVGHRQSDDPDVLVVPNEEALSRARSSRFWRGLHGRLQPLVQRRVPGASRLERLAGEWADWGTWLYSNYGIANYRFPGTWRLLELPPEPPDVVHCHNLHGEFFDLRILSWLSRKVPVILSLHDPWLLTGGCTHSFDCERWRTGCGRCPLLHSGAWPNHYPKRDGSIYNWWRKRRIYARSRLHVVTPCRWLMHRVEQSILAPGAVERRVIPYGVDRTLFHPADKRAVRATLGIPPDAKVFLFIAHHLKANPAKDYPTIRATVARIAKRVRGQRVLFIARGDNSPPERIGDVEIRFVPFQKDFRDVARHYQAADIYLHAANVDTFPNVILEALACGTPVVATAVCGIPEQIKSLDLGSETTEWKAYGAHEATGILVPRKDSEAMAGAIERLMNDESLRWRLGENAARDAEQRFDLAREVDGYLKWYEELSRVGAVKASSGLVAY